MRSWSGAETWQKVMLVGFPAAVKLLSWALFALAGKFEAQNDIWEHVELDHQVRTF